MKPSNKMTGEIGAGYVTSPYRKGFGPLVTLTCAAMTQPIFILVAALLCAFRADGQTVTWTGGNSYGSWSNTNNWNPKAVPLNGGGTTYTVIVPDANSLSFDVPGGGAIDALSFGVGSQMLVSNGQSLTVNGVAVIKGQIQAKGAGSSFHAPANTVVLSSSPQFLATNGATIAMGASTYSWDRSIGNATLLSASGTNSLVDLHGVSSMLLNGNNNPIYTISARTNGAVDLSGLANLSGPGGSGVLELNVDSGGQIKLDSARQFSQNLRFNLGVPVYQLPQAVAMDSVTINQTATGKLDATNLLTIADSTLNSATGGVYNLPALASMASSTVNLTTGAVFAAPQLWSLNAVPVNIAGNGSFQASNLVSYINSTIPIQPGRDFESGLLTNIYGSSISVRGGASFRVAAAAYEIPPAGNYTYPPRNLFLSDGSGSLLDLSSLKSLRVYGAGYVWDPAANTWRYDFIYFINAANQGVIDLSGLQVVYGTDPNNYNGGDDWLSFKVESGGTILLPNLKVVTQRTRFDLLTPQFAMPALQAVDHTLFSLQDGGRLDLASLTNFNNSSISFGFNSTFSAPQLRSFQNSTLNLAPGQILTTALFTNIDASRISVSSGSTLAVAAPTYQAPSGQSATVFSADGAGSRLDLSSMGLLNTVSGDSGHTYTVAVNNSGVVNLSGLQTIQAGSDAWQLSLQNSGSILLPGLQQVSGAVSFVLGAGTRLDLPNLRRLADGTSISFGAGTTFNAPALVEYVNSDLNIATPGAFVALPLTNIYASRLAVSGGSSLSVTASQYEVPPYGNYTYPGSPIRFSADGAGSWLDLSSLQSIRIYGIVYAWDPLVSTWRYDWDLRANASNQGVVDLSGLQTVYGADPNNYDGGDDWFSFNARSGGAVKMGNVATYQKTRFSAADPNSMLDFAGLYLRPPGTLRIGPSSLLRIRGSFLFENTDANSLTGDLATLLMDGAVPQRLEVGGRDVGPAATFGQGNFGFGQLVVGNTNQQSIVRLVDTLNNGGRGAAGEPESLYLYGLGGQGLRLLSASRLLLGNIKCYALVNGQSVNLRSLIPVGTNSVAYDGGFIANFGGPSITNMTPSLAVTPAVSSVDISFNLPIQTASFAANDVQIAGPGGSITPTSVALVSGTTWRISFPAQTADGTYTVSVGPNLNELAGNFLGMDQNGDGLSGDGTNDTFTGTFIIDGTGPRIVSALALQNGTRVGVTFDEPIAPATATNASAYTINGVTPMRVVLQPDGKSVALDAAPLVGDSFALSTAGLADLLGNATNRSFTGSILTMEDRDLGVAGNPAVAGSALTFTGTDFEMRAGGSDFYWNGYDAGHFADEPRYGDFDVQVQVAGMTTAETYTQAGLMWRESTAADSRRVYVCLNSPSNANRYWGLIRLNPGAAGVDWPSYSGPAVNAFPNVWIRMQRQGNVFTAYKSSDGTNWNQYGQVTAAFTAAGIVGPAASARNNSSSVSVTYRNFADRIPSVVSQPQSQTVASGSTVNFGVNVRGLPTLAYQWYFNGVSVGGGTSSLLSLNSVAVTNVGDYRCVITNNYGSTTSLVATLVVDGVGSGGFEADLMPQPNGDNAATISDWVKVGRLVAKLDTVLNSSEFQRVDCAPRMVGTNVTLGDGRLTVADWTQAGRYAAGLDPLTPAGGPTQPVVGPLLKPFAYTPHGLGRNLTVSSLTAWQGTQIEVPVLLNGAQGNENAIGFSVTFDPARLTYQGVILGKDASGAWLQVNAQRVNDGQLGLVLAQPVGRSLSSGILEMARVRFAAVGSAGSAALQLTDAPVVCELVDTVADTLPMALINGAVQIVPQPGFASVQLLPGGGLQLLLSGPSGQTCLLQASTNLVDWVTLSTNVLGSAPLPVVDATAPTGKSRFYKLTPAQ
jgi:regulation of enolase protein 1 (concanavalin A-like superfamily)